MNSNRRQLIDSQSIDRSTLNSFTYNYANEMLPDQPSSLVGSLPVVNTDRAGGGEARVGRKMNYSPRAISNFTRASKCRFAWEPGRSGLVSARGS